MPTSAMMNKVVFDEEGKRGLVKSSWNEKASCSNESSSSSIGKNSDLSEDLSEKSGDDDDEEVESKYKGPLDAMDALEQVLPIRRGISRFYNGKSKSFASLADASSSSSIKEIAKPNNAYTRKRTNMLALRAYGNGNGISKRTTSSGRSALALADFCSLRSFSLADLQQHCVSAVAVSCLSLHEFGSNPSLMD
ncbi:hypothetical protein PHJA_002148600 [Phtheirospermum japonicum]|uniref:Uncharacterized protein n=1 Tax=Phtheirospermum japonicum TaxID=374723 RepID=A0A830CY91_9LAMI|nr:hypothetical protein PHJA_002148600 [Phtheirospermum japonicum]